MSREIKFRGYDFDDKRWIFGTPLEYINCVVGFTEDDRPEQHETWMIFTEMTDWESPQDVKVCKTIDKDSVGQYTGLHDKNGKEIYEGDIVKVGNTTCFVVFEDGAFRLKSKQFKYIDCVLQEHISTRIGEVIGNIYEKS